MSCLCYSSSQRADQVKAPPSSSSDTKEQPDTIAERSYNDSDEQTIMVQEFTFQELADATQNFSLDCLVGKGSFGNVYRGKLQQTGEIVSVKRLDSNKPQRHSEFLEQVSTLRNLHHPNLIHLKGYCIADCKRIFLVHEYLPLGSLHQHLHDKQKPPLEWYRRMKIGLGIARGLEWLHNANLIYRNLKPTNILLDNDFNVKLSDFGLAEIEHSFDEVRLGFNGYRAPEYLLKGHMTKMADVFSFGVVLLELITGRCIFFVNSDTRKQAYLVKWARKKFKAPRDKFRELADPLLQGKFPSKGLYQSLAVAAMCLQEERVARPVMSDLVTAMMYLSSQESSCSSSCRAC